MPPGQTAGGVADFWQRSITDLRQTGPDQGKDGKYLLVPLGQNPPTTSKSYHLLRPQTMNVSVGLRVLDPDPVKSKKLVAKLKLYPYAERKHPPRTRLLSPNGRKWSG